MIEIDKDDVLAHTSLSMIYHAQGRIEDAEKEGDVAKIMGNTSRKPDCFCCPQVRIQKSV